MLQDGIYYSERSDQFKQDTQNYLQEYKESVFCS